MFGANINSFGQIQEIAEGFANYALDKEKELSDYRSSICENCPIYNKENGRCDSKRGINTKTGEFTQIPGKDVVMGCGCILSRKWRSPKSKCPLSKWER